MNGTFRFPNNGTCSRAVSFKLVDGKVEGVAFEGGCPGNLLGIGSLVRGMDAAEAISRLEGHRCGDKATSCPDQLAKAIRKALTEASS